MKKAQTLADMVRQCPMVSSGRRFCASEVARLLKVETPQVSATLTDMFARDELVLVTNTVRGTYYSKKNECHPMRTPWRTISNRELFGYGSRYPLGCSQR
jgi:hypothetical protein